MAISARYRTLYVCNILLLFASNQITAQRNFQNSIPQVNHNKFASLCMGGVGCAALAAALLGSYFTYTAQKELTAQHSEFDRLYKLLEEMGAKVMQWRDREYDLVYSNIKVTWDKQHPRSSEIEKHAQALTNLFDDRSVQEKVNRYFVYSGTCAFLAYCFFYNMSP